MTHFAEKDALCEHTGMPVDACLCMVHDPDGAHFRATRPGMAVRPLPPEVEQRR